MSKFLTDEETAALLKRLQMTFGAEIETVNEMIRHDIRMFGHLSHQTKEAKKILKEKMEEEKEAYKDEE